MFLFIPYDSPLFMKHQCKKCDHRWLSHLENPKECPHCKSRKWKCKNQKQKKRK